MPGVAAIGILENAGTINCFPVGINDSEVLISCYESVSHHLSNAIDTNESPIFLHTPPVILLLNMLPKGQKWKASSPHPDSLLSTKRPPNMGWEEHEMCVAIGLHFIHVLMRYSTGCQ